MKFKIGDTIYLSKYIEPNSNRNKCTITGYDGVWGSYQVEFPNGENDRLIMSMAEKHWSKDQGVQSKLYGVFYKK